jgi:hypothetical protein
MEMSNQNTDINNDDSFDQTLKELYAFSLLDESFQQQQLTDLEQIPEDKRALLNQRAQAFITPPEPPVELKQRIFAELEQHHLIKPEQTARSRWAKLFSWQDVSFSFLSPAVIAPVACAFGVFIGFILLPVTNAPLTADSEDSFVTNDSSNTINTISTTTSTESASLDHSTKASRSMESLLQEGIFADNDEDRLVTRGAVNTSSNQSHEDNAKEWLEYIIPLIREGEIAEAIIELQQFRKRYPDYELGEL